MDVSLPRDIRYAARWNNKKVAQVLLDRSTDINAVVNDGRQALHIAVGSIFGDDVAQLLLENGADLARKDLRGHTPLHIACKVCNISEPLLLGFGADLEAKDKKGRLPKSKCSTMTNENTIYMYRSGELIQQ